ncbi:hypothetical protein BC939DRAFT_252627 [Gamsiella multidivaricata]|uniref:uncharacterized protein n=1 Tax=Gamsiella multidivaricata TaxID=101098 RepID=UPI002220B1C2|nr:uncharacterized protein BC939DRAFT_252627 [Gamsiella multidivaricata]KAI7819579.1 hypothetical protein BC939DRAFT_252627 [Gamsiella multidivaricata]
MHTKPNVDTFVVTVQRTDDLLADDGTFLAERVMAVAFNFDVQDHEVLINKVPLNFGSQEKPEEPITVTVTVEAGVIVGPALDPETKVDDLMEAFDTGLVTVQVTASTEFVPIEDGSIVRRVTLRETIVEVNGLEITQTDAAQQVFEIMPDGSLGSYTPLPFGNSGCQPGKDFEDAMESIDEWFRSLNWPGFLCAGLVAVSMFVFSATSLRSLIQKRRQARYAKIHQHEAADEFVQVTVIEDKKLDDEKKALNL